MEDYEDGSIEAIGTYFRPEDKGTKGNVDFKPKYIYLIRYWSVKHQILGGYKYKKLMKIYTYKLHISFWMQVYISMESEWSCICISGVYFASFYDFDI